MKTVSEACRQLLATGSFQKWYVADLWYDGERMLVDVPLVDVQITEDDSRAIKTSGRVGVVWTDDFGVSILPLLPGDLFAPFGSELAVYAIVAAGEFQERVPMGWFQITDVPEMRDSVLFWGGSVITTGSTLTLTLMDRMIQVERDPFDVPTSPVNLLSVWDEIGRLTGFQLVRTVTDRAIDREVNYQDSKLQAVLDLADLLDAVPYMTPDGALSMRPKVSPTVAVDTLRRGDDGTVIWIGKGMSSDGVYNKVVFRGHGEDQKEIYAVAEVASGPLRTQNLDGSRSPAHRRTIIRSNDLIVTNAQAQVYVNAELVRVSTQRQVQWPVEEVWNPTREIGDVVDIVDERGVAVSCRITALTRNGEPTHRMEVDRGI